MVRKSTRGGPSAQTHLFGTVRCTLDRKTLILLMCVLAQFPGIAQTGIIATRTFIRGAMLIEENGVRCTTEGERFRVGDVCRFHYLWTRHFGRRADNFVVI